MSRFLTAALLAGGTLACAQANALDALNWQNNSLTYLYGQDYRVDAPTQQVLTFEHASDWSVGDLFFFVDAIRFNGQDDSSLYGEFAPRLSLGKLAGTPLSFGPIKDVLLAATYEFGEDDVESYLLGPGFDLALPGFDYFQLNVYQRHTESGKAGDGVWQITPVWSYTLALGNSDLVIDGYIDWVVDNHVDAAGNEYHANLHFNPQIKYDLGKALKLGEKQLYVGIEYDYWKDKYGIQDGGYVSQNFVGSTEQNTASLLVKVHF